MNAQLLSHRHACGDCLVSIRQAAGILKVNRNWLSAYAKGMGIEFISLGPSLGIWRSDVEKIRLKLESEKGKTA
jgi:hypothetical protein